MQTKTDQSYGVIPLYKTDAAWEVLLIEQIGRRGDTFWTLPKGHPESDESPLQAAARELQEEAGVVAERLLEAPTFTTTYTFIYQGSKIAKRVDYFLGFCCNQATSISQPEEIKSLRWCDFEMALQTLSHDNTKQLLLQVAAYLDES